MWKRLREAFERLDKLRCLQLFALLWIGYELHQIAENVYQGPSPYDETAHALSNIADQLERIAKAIAYK
ncbi:MAG: hypothetical protein JSR19_07045 [Proteobacteria bacterium]|nr:hypothetical protein [Pseudomonadota bacterium]